MPRPTRTTPSRAGRAVGAVLPVVAVVMVAGACVAAGAAALEGPDAAAVEPRLHVAPAAVTTQVAPEPVHDTDPRVVYTQAGPVVTVTRDGQLVATITATALERQGSGARLTLGVQAAQAFVLSDDAFVLEDTAGAEDALPATGEQDFSAGSATTVLDWPTASPGARAGAVLWGPGTQTAGVWLLPDPAPARR